MSAAPDTTPQPQAASRVADGLVDLVRRLAAFGREVLGTLQRGNTGFPPMSVACRFGSINLALIIARLTRGLMIAQALEDRLLRRRGPRPTPPAPARTQAKTRPHTPRKPPDR